MDGDHGGGTRMLDMCTGLLIDHRHATALGVGRITVPRSWSHAVHHHPFHQVMMVMGGGLEIVAGDKRHLVGSGDWVFYPAGMVHGERAGRNGVDLVYVAIDGRIQGLPLTCHDQTGRGRIIAGWLADTRQMTEARQQHETPLLVHLLLLALTDAAQRREPDFVTTVRSWIDDHLHLPLSVADLAAQAHMSPAHFARSWRAATGQTPIDTLRRRRVEQARDLLITTRLPLKAIADQVGACDAHHLSRWMRRYLGHPPGFFRGAPLPSPVPD